MKLHVCNVAVIDHVQMNIQFLFHANFFLNKNLVTDGFAYWLRTYHNVIHDKVSCTLEGFHSPQVNLKVFQLIMKIMIVSGKLVFCLNTNSFSSTIPQGSERRE